jgi:predicted transcriptional regulator of viral defense system
MSRIRPVRENMENKAEKLVAELKKRGVLKTQEIIKMGISKEYLRILHNSGKIERIARGFYVLENYEISAMQSFAEVSKQNPAGVICLLSALRYHGFTTQNPFEVWIAIERRAWKPQANGTTQIRYMRFSDKAFTSGVQIKEVNNVKIKVYSPAKTVADCFKYRNKIGLDVALEALREGWKEKRFIMDELWKYAKICRVSNVMRPYLESMTTF